MKLLDRNDEINIRSPDDRIQQEAEDEYSRSPRALNHVSTTAAGAVAGSTAPAAASTVARPAFPAATNRLHAAAQPRRRGLLPTGPARNASSCDGKCPAVLER